jgi:microcystin-dependent protein
MSMHGLFLRLSGNSSLLREKKLPIASPKSRSLRHEPLEDRRMLSLGGLHGTLDVPDVLLTTQMVGDIEFTQVDVPQWGSEGTIGRPELPVYRTSYAVPENCEIEVSYTIQGETDLGEGYLVYPMQAPKEESAAPSIDFVYDADFYKNSEVSQTDVFWVSDPLIAGDNYSIALEFRPFQYDVLQGDISYVTGIDYEITFHEKAADSAQSPLDAESNFLISGGIQGEALSAADADYLIITADPFYEEIMPLAQWKQDKGYRTYTAKMSDIGSTDVEIKAFIQAAYDADPVKPQYVLLVGDHENVPSHYVQGAFWTSDYEYSLTAGDDIFADLAVGRLPGETEEQISIMVKRSLGYELTPDLGDWYYDALLAGQFQDIDHNGAADHMFMEDINRAADFLGGDFGYYADPETFDLGYTIHTDRVWDAEPDSLLSYGGWDYPGRIDRPDSVPDAWKNLPDEGVTNVINAGASLVMHRGHGSTDGWSQPSFATSDVHGLTNADATPFVFSLNCSSGMFDTGDSFAEAWLRNDQGGAVAYVGAQSTSYSGYNDALFVGILDAMWNDYDSSWSSTRYDTGYRVGDVMNYARDRVLDGYGVNDGTAVATARLFNVLGDPELMLRTEAPSVLSVTNSNSVAMDAATDFNVTVSQDGAVVAGAMVAISSSESSDYWVGETDENGQVVFTGLTTRVAGAYDVVVTGHNAIPFLGTLDSVAPGVDLKGTSVSVQATDLYQTGEVTVDFIARNVGSVDAGASNIRFYLSDDANIDPAVDMPLSLSTTDSHYDAADSESYHLDALASLASHNGTVVLQTPLDDTLGTDNEYFIGMIVDADADVIESNETNNVTIADSPVSLAELLPEIEIAGLGQVIADNDVTPEIADNTDFGEVDLVHGSEDRQFIITNTGTAPLDLTDPTSSVRIIGADADDFTVSVDASSTVSANGGSTSFTITFNPSETGLRTAVVVIANNDGDESSYEFAIQGTSTATPDIDVQFNDISIEDGDTTASQDDGTYFGTLGVNSGTIKQTFTIQNVGSANLDLNGASPVQLLGIDSWHFNVTAQPDAQLSSDGSVTFEVEFDPTVVGTYSAVVSIETNDPDEPIFDFVITATGSDITGVSEFGQPQNNMQPYTVVNYIIALWGIFPSRNGEGAAEGSDQFIGEINMFAGNFAPREWAFCNGQLLAISQNQSLFSILGTTYGGDGRTTFGLPDLRGRVPVGEGPGYTLGAKSGTETNTLTINQIPSHNHILPGGVNDTGYIGASQQINNMQPWLSLNYIIATVGTYPSRDGEAAEGMEPYLGEIVLFAGNFAPRSWAFCDGQLLSISENTALFSLLGTTYGGDGRTTFGLPDLQGRTAIHAGTGAGLTPRSLGSEVGTVNKTLNLTQLPSHNHTISPLSSPTTNNGGGQNHNNMMPSLAVNYIIALYGTYPSRNGEAAEGALPYIAEISMFAGNFAPRSWALCDGQLLPISQYDALFSLIGTIYGGDGRTTLRLPRMRGRAVVHSGLSTGPGLTTRPQGQVGGTQTEFVTIGQMPNHSHSIPDFDWGDAPTPYATLLTDNGPAHALTSTLYMGASIPDAEIDGQPSTGANGDDTIGSDDEDGVVNPSGLLDLIEGFVPQIDVSVTNNTGVAATLYGWIDYNGDGVFDNATERASIAVPTGTSAGVMTLTFPVIPDGAASTSYARFRLSTDPVAADSTGGAGSGEVEDYPVAIKDVHFLNGTTGDDTVNIWPGTPGVAQHRVDINSVSSFFDAAVYDAILVDGLGGDDTLNVYGKTTTENTAFDGTSVHVSESTVYDVYGQGFESAYFYGGGGDTIQMLGSSGNDNFYGNSTYSYLRGDSNAFFNFAKNFETLEVDMSAMPGGTDNAYIYDSPGDDILIAGETQAMLDYDSTVSPGVDITAIGFDRIDMYGQNGGTDDATLTGSSGDDTFTGLEGYSYLTGNGGAFVNYVKGFDAVKADVSTGGGGGEDSATLYDSSGDDKLTADGSLNVLDYNATGAPDPNVSAIGFPNVSVYALFGGDDTATLAGSAGDDRFTGRDTYGQMKGNSGAFINYAKGFDMLTADVSGTGGTDIAILYDAPTDDELVASETEAIFDYAATVGFDANLTARGFDQTYSYATSGGNDISTMLGSTGDDRFTAKQTYNNLRGDGGAYFHYASGFEESLADVSVGGGDDVAFLYDAPTDDFVRISPTQALLNYDAVASPVIDVTATGFPEVYAYAEDGGTDAAILHGSSGIDKFYGLTNYSYLRAGDYSYFNYVRGFDTIRANASGSDDVAFLYDSDGDDTLTVTPTSTAFQLIPTVGTPVVNTAADFDQVHAYASTGGGNDLALIYDSSGNDVYTATPTTAVIDFNATPGVNDPDVMAYGFERVDSHSTNGGNDTATLTGSGGADLFYGLKSFSYLKADDSSYYNYVSGYDAITANAVGLGDYAYLYDSNGNDILNASPSSTEFILNPMTGPTVTNTANAFDRVFSYASAGGTDAANMNGTTGDDTFTGLNDWGRLTSTGSSAYYNYVRYFDEVFADPGDTDVGNDLLDDQGVTYTLDSMPPNGNVW